MAGGQNENTFLYTKSEKRYPYHLNLDKTWEELGDEHYYRVNRSQIIHIDDLQSTERLPNQRLACHLRSGRTASVSRNRVEGFLSWMNS